MDLASSTSAWLKGLVFQASIQRNDLLVERSVVQQKIEEIDKAIAELDAFSASGLVAVASAAPSVVSQRHIPQSVRISQKRARQAESRILRALSKGPQQLADLVLLTRLPRERGLGLIERMKIRKKLIQSNNAGLYTLAGSVEQPKVVNRSINVDVRSFLQQELTTPRSVPELFGMVKARNLGFTMGMLSGVIRRMVSSGALIRQTDNGSVTFVYS